MDKYLAPLLEKMYGTTNPEKAVWAKKYLKDQFEMLGIDALTRKLIFRKFLSDKGLPDIEQLESVSWFLWQLDEREFQYIALEIIMKSSKKLREQDIDWIEKLIVTKSWWDTVDGIAAWICGKYFQLYPSQIIPVTQKWIDSKNIWLQRSALLFQLKYKQKTDTILLSLYMQKLSNQKEFFIRKAIGWILREYSKTNKEFVGDFVSKYSLSPLSYREATKYL
jgi:3-methyladenine DNA glycosylase AlkD